MTCEHLTPVLHPHGSELIVHYDEHVLSNHYKFGVVYQRFGQTQEEEVFGNERHSPAMDQFLDVLGDRVQLQGFTGYELLVTHLWLSVSTCTFPVNFCSFCTSVF